MPEFLDATHTPLPTVSRWDRGDGQAAIQALDTALVKAGLVGRLEAPMRLLARAALDRLSTACVRCPSNARPADADHSGL